MIFEYGVTETSVYVHIDTTKVYLIPRGFQGFRAMIFLSAALAVFLALLESRASSHKLTSYLAPRMSTDTPNVSLRQSGFETSAQPSNSAPWSP